MKAQEGQTATPCQISWQSVKTLRTYVIFRFFQDGSRPPSGICDAHVWTTHKGHLVVFTTVQNLVGTDVVVSIICKF